MTDNEIRFDQAHRKISAGKEYVDYLFKVTESYVGSAKVFTGISGTLLALPFFQLKLIMILVQRHQSVLWIIGGSWFFLALSILVGAFYQGYSVRIIEDEVEFEGVNYDKYTKWLRYGYIALVLSMVIGIILTIWYVLLVFYFGESGDLMKFTAE